MAGDVLGLLRPTYPVSKAFLPNGHRNPTGAVQS
jgi:hypothetical protein